MRAFVVAGLALLAGLAQAAPEPPRLAVLFVVDGLPLRHVQAWTAQLAPDGLRRFLDHGAVFTQARYRHAHTVTCPGHATLITGAWPRQHGIIGNDWLDPQSGRSGYCAEDETQQRLLAEATPPRSGTSPSRLRAETLGESLRRARSQAKVVAVSGKDRGAIVPAGPAGQAYFYAPQRGLFTSTSFFMERHPAWLLAFNARRPADAFAGAWWRALRAEADYAGDAPDGSPWMAQAGYGNRLPAQLPPAGARLWGDLMSTPLGDAHLLELARAAVRGEQLGADAVPDLLVVSLSAHDAINHLFGPESRLAHDHLLQLDRLLQDFMRWLDAELGRRRWTAVLATDHGFTDSPEWARQQGRNAGRLPLAPLIAALNAELQQRYGVPKLVRGGSASGLLFDESLLAGLPRAALLQHAADWLRGLDGVAAAYPEDALRSNAPSDDALLQAARLSWFEGRSAQLFVVLRPGWMGGSRGSTHGSPHDTDQHVPLLAWGPNWWRGGRFDEPVTPADVAPSLARLLGVAPPAQAQGRPLPALRLQH